MALYIKKDRMKDLEKFGFIKEIPCQLVKNYEEAYTTGVIDKCEILGELYNDYGFEVIPNGKIMINYEIYTGITTGSITKLDVLYDLIKADMVEKVTEDVED